MTYKEELIEELLKQREELYNRLYECTPEDKYEIEFVNERIDAIDQELGLICTGDPRVLERGYHNG